MKIHKLLFPLTLLQMLSLSICIEAAEVTLTGQEEQEKLEPIYWPQIPRPKLDVSEYTSEFDGHLIDVLEIGTRNFAIEVFGRPNFYVGAPTSPRHSLAIEDHAIPGVDISLSVFDPKEFLPNLNVEGWNGYLEGLKRSDPSTRIVFENTNLEGRVTPYVFGKQFRQVAYERGIEGKSTKTREIFAFIDGELLVIRAEGRKEAVDQAWFKFEHLIGEMSYAKKEVDTDKKAL